MSDSLIGYEVGSLVDHTSQDSLIGFVAGLLYEQGIYQDSLIGYTSSALMPPHFPIGTWNGTSIVWSAIGTWNGTDIV